MQDGFKLRLGISKADSLQKERTELLSKLDLPSVGEFLLKPGTEPISDMLLAFLRVFSMRKAELTHWLRSDKVFDLKHMDCALETVVEENVRKFLLTRLHLLSLNYPTTLKVKVKPRSRLALPSSGVSLTNLFLSLSLFTGGPGTIGDHVAAGEEDGRSTEGHGEEDSLGRCRIRGAVD